MILDQDPRILQSIASSATPSQAPEKAKDLKQLRESARDFEAMYMFEVYKSMRKNVPDNGLIKKSFSEKMFQEMLDMELSRTAAEGEGMGIGKAMYDQLKENVR